MPPIIRTITEDEFPDWHRASSLAFGGHATAESTELDRLMCEPDRTFAAFDGRRVVGTATTRTSAIAVPGGSAPLGFVDDVAVIPTHRRRGIMTRMMRAQLAQMRERGEPFAALHASESLIYGRFGYGIATWAERWKILRVHAKMSAEPNADGGNLEFADADEARAEWPPLHRRAAGARPGAVAYSDAYWRYALSDAEHHRRGASAFFHVACKRGGRVVGMASYRVRYGDGVVLVVFLLGEDSEIEAALWAYCFGIDLRNEIHAFNRPTDDPLAWRLADPRRLERAVHDHTWLRLVDVAAALRARRYDAEGELSIRVRDRFCEWNDGVYLLESGADGAEVRKLPQSSPADLELGVSDLAAAHLGGVSPSNLARAGRIRETAPGALRTADRLFRTARPPWTLEL